MVTLMLELDEISYHNTIYECMQYIVWIKLVLVSRIEFLQWVENSQENPEREWNVQWNLLEDQLLIKLFKPCLPKYWVVMIVDSIK